MSFASTAVTTASTPSVLLNGPRPEKHPRPRRRRGLTYSQQIEKVLTAVWEAAGHPWSVRLKALLP